MRSIFFFSVVFLLIIFPSNISLATEDDIPVISDDGKYHLHIIMTQWTFYVYQLQENESIAVAYKEGNYIAKSGPDAAIGPFSVDTEIVFDVYTADVQHGFTISKLGIALATNRPMPGELLGEKRSVATMLPAEPTVLESYCHIFCGLGHPDERMNFIVGTSMETNSDILRIPVLFLPLVISLFTIIYLKKRK